MPQNDSHENKSCEKEQIEKLQKICDVLNDEICSKNQVKLNLIFHLLK